MGDSVDDMKEKIAEMEEQASLDKQKVSVSSFK